MKLLVVNWNESVSESYCVDKDPHRGAQEWENCYTIPVPGFTYIFDKISGLVHVSDGFEVMPVCGVSWYIVSDKEV